VGILFGTAFTKFTISLVKKLATFGYVVGVFLPRNYKFILRILNWSANERKTLPLSDESLEGRALPWRVRGRNAEWTILREMVWCLAGIEAVPRQRCAIIRKTIWYK
jgi:hypothetical protein